MRELLPFAERLWAREDPRPAADAFAVFFRPLELLFARAVFVDTTYAWNRHAPVLGFSGEPDRTIIGRLSAPTPSNVLKIAHFAEKSMIYGRKASRSRHFLRINLAQG